MELCHQNTFQLSSLSEVHGCCLEWEDLNQEFMDSEDWIGRAVTQKEGDAIILCFFLR